MVEAASTYKSSLTFYQTTQGRVLKDNHILNRRRENLKISNIFPILVEREG
jgi:hypothetical protein